MIYLSKIVEAGVDKINGFYQKVKYRAKNANTLVVYPFGYHANANNDSLVLTFGANGQAASRLGIPTDNKNRPVLKQGEIALYQPALEITTLIKFDESGDIKINTNTNIELVGNTKVVGNFEVTGSTTLSADVTSNGKDISDTHTHTGSPTAPSGPVSPTGVVV